MMIEMQYEYSNSQAYGVGGVAAGGFASSVFEAKCKEDGNFTNIEPISVLDTRSPSPSTSTSTFPSFNNTTQQGNVAVNKHTMVTSVTAACGGGEKEEYLIGLQPVHNAGLDFSHGLSEKFYAGIEEWANWSESAGYQNEILKLLLQAGNQNEVQGNMVFGAMNRSPELTGVPSVATVGNDFSNYNTSALGVSDPGFSFNENKGIVDLDSNCLLDHNNCNNVACLVPGTTLGKQFETLDQKVESFNSNALNPLFVQNASNLNITNFNPLLFGAQQEQQNQLQSRNHQNATLINSNLGTQNLNIPFVDMGLELLLMKQQRLHQMLQPSMDSCLHSDFGPLHQLKKKPFLVPKQETVGGCMDQMNTDHNQLQQQQQQIVYDQLYKATELIMAGNFSNAQGILARLNQLLSPIVKPFQRSAFYVKEALQLAFMMHNQVTSLPPRIPTPLDCMFKMGAYKVFSEVSPVIQFMNFTAIQTLLEALDDAEQIHILDFDIGFGAHWSSFLKELPRKNSGMTSVKITAFASPCTHHPIEISLMHENLTEFANDLGIIFELEVVNIDSFNPDSSSVSSFRSSESEAIAVNFPLWSFTNYLTALPSYLCLIKKLSPKILVSLDRGCDRIDLPFSHHILHILQYYESLLDSVDAANMASDASDKIEKFLFQPRIESTILGRVVYPDVMPPWRNLFATIGFLPASISNFAETQAECVLKRAQVKGFHVKRQQSSLALCWQPWELMSVSAWNC